MVKVEIIVLMDEEGNYEVAKDDEQAAEQAGCLSSDNGTLAIRVVRLSIDLDPPEVQDVEIDVPAEAGRRTMATVE